MDDNRNTRKLVLENVEVGFKNFMGRKTKYNRSGKKTFSAFMDPEQGEMLEKDGWNIKWTKVRDPQDISTPYLNITVNYDGQTAPSLFIVTPNKKTLLNSETVNLLDNAEIEFADLIINPYEWEIPGDNPGEIKSGITAYLDTGYFNIFMNPLMEKYSDVPMDGDVTEDSGAPFDI